MDNWVKYANLLMTFALTTGCHSANHMRQLGSDQVQVDSLPATIIEPELQQRDSSMVTDTSAMIFELPIECISAQNQRLKSGKEANLSNFEHLLDLRAFHHVHDQDLKNAVVDIGNIIYLKRDF